MIRPAGSRTSNEPSRPAWTNYQIKGLICLYKCRTVVDLNLFVGHIQLSREFLPYGLQLLLQVVPLLFQWQTSDLKLLSHLLRQHKRKDNIRRTKTEQLKKRYIQTVWQSAAGIWSRFNYSEEKALSSKETFQKVKWRDCHEMTSRLVSISVVIESYFRGATKQEWYPCHFVIIAMRNGCLHNQHHSASGRKCHLAKLNRRFGNSGNAPALLNRTEYLYV